MNIQTRWYHSWWFQSLLGVCCALVLVVFLLAVALGLANAILLAFGYLVDG